MNEDETCDEYLSSATWGYISDSAHSWGLRTFVISTASNDLNLYRFVLCWNPPVSEPSKSTTLSWPYLNRRKPRNFQKPPIIMADRQNSGFLCDKCKSLHFTSHAIPSKLSKFHSSELFQNLTGRFGKPRQVRRALFVLGPFRETIDQTLCAFCKILRHVVELHDSHPGQVLLVCRNLRKGGYRIERHAEALESLTDYKEDSCIDSMPLIAVTDKRLYEYLSPIPPTARNAAKRTKVWISECATSHDECSTTHEHLTSGEFVPMFSHVIDVARRRVVRTERPSARSKAYFALSYVYGKADFLQLLRQNEATLCSRGALSKAILPRTFEDAILFTRSCNVPYLWVDTLVYVRTMKKSSAIKSARWETYIAWPLWFLLHRWGILRTSDSSLDRRH